MHINERLKNGGDLGSWSSGEDGYKAQEITEGETNGARHQVVGF